MKSLITKILSIILIPTIIGGIVYLIGSFVAYDFNPINWSEAGRALIAVLELMGLGVGIVLAFED